MPYQIINVTIPSADVQAVTDPFAAVLTKLPVRVNLTVSDSADKLFGTIK